MRCGARWPADSNQLEIFKTDNPQVALLTEECPEISATGVGTADSIKTELQSTLRKSDGGMVCVNQVDCNKLWSRLCDWLCDPLSLKMVTASAPMCSVQCAVDRNNLSDCLAAGRWFSEASV